MCSAAVVWSRLCTLTWSPPFNNHKANRTFKTYYSTKWGEFDDGEKLAFHVITLTVLIALVAIFEIGSIISATAPTSKALIAGRVVTGIGGAGTTSGALVLINSLVPLRSRPAVSGTFALF